MQGYTLDLCAPSSTSVHPPRDPHDKDKHQDPSLQTPTAQAGTPLASGKWAHGDPKAEAPSSPSTDTDLASRDTREHQEPQDCAGGSQRKAQEAFSCDARSPLLSQGSGDGAGGPWGDPPECSSILGAVYLAGKGPRERVVGATRRGGLTPEEALQECGRAVESGPEWDAAVDALLPQAEAVWAPAATWEVRRVRTGVRALPPRTAEGSAPLAGRVPVPGERY